MLLWKGSGSGSGYDYGFNPCSLGCCSERHIEVLTDFCVVMFQSLFSWMLLWKTNGIRIRELHWFSFNPCSLGCCSESRDGQITDPDRVPVRFNPCSLGCCSERKKTPRRAHHTSSFNPCSLGCCSESQGGQPKPESVSEVSILVLLDVALKVLDRHQMNTLTF